MEGLYIKQETIDYYMEIKKIKKYTDLLYRIGIELGYKDEKLKNFPNFAKANFSKMLKGNRPLNAEYIIPLEKILGITLAKMKNPEKYEFNIDKEEVPFVKGIRYYAYKDEMNLYKNELLNLLNNEGKSIIFNTDEFGKSFLDYVIEYNSINGIRFLSENFDMKLKRYHNYFDINGKNVVNPIFQNSLPLVRMIAKINDAELFYNIYDTYNLFVSNKHYANDLYENDEFLKVILENDILFESLLTEKEYTYIYGNISNKKLNKDSITIKCINPITNNCLRYALNNIEKYRNQVIKMINFGISNNKDVLLNSKRKNIYPPKELLGGLWDDNDNFYGYLIYTDMTTKDEEVNKLINKLAF
mgnify:CR=1 FL=1